MSALREPMTTEPCTIASKQPLLPAEFGGADDETGRVRAAGHDFELFMSAPPMIRAMVRDICSARSRVWMETYIFANDRAGSAIADALSEQARAGLDVRLMYDAVGSFSTPAALFDRMREAGVKIHAYHTLAYALRKFRLFSIFNRRDHRKLLVVDDRVAYFGGMNIVDQSDVQTVEEAKRRNLPTSAGWRDVHTRMTGPKQSEVAGAFEWLWKRVHHQHPGHPPRWPIRALVQTRVDSVWLFAARPTLRDRRAVRVFAPLIRNARRSIVVSMAYFVPDGLVLRELVRARRRGVKIRVIVPGQSDVPIVQAATRHLYRFLLSHGVRIYERNDQMLHSKTMVIDGTWTLIGSCNLDPRSLRLNLEYIGVVRARSMAAAVLRICLFDLRNSRRVTSEDPRNRWRRMLDRAAWSVRRWL